MAAWRQAMELAIGGEDLAALGVIARSRTEPARRVERARMLLAYRDEPSFFAVAQTAGVHHQTVQRCIERALAYGPIAALDDLPRPGREPTITAEAKAWVVNLACRKAKELGYPHELWTTRLLARHVREHGPAEGHACLGLLAQGTLCNILNEQRSNRTKCATTWSVATPNSKRKWRRFCASIGRSSSSRRPQPPPTKSRAMPWRSCPMTRSPVFRRSPRRHRTCRPSPAGTRLLHASTNTSATVRSVCWPALICSLVKFTPSSGIATAAANSSNSSSLSTLPIRPIRRSD